MNLKYLRKELRSMSKSLDIKYSYVYILLYAYHSETFSNNEVVAEVPFGCETISRGIRRLSTLGLINKVHGGGGKNKLKALYSISGKGKLEVKRLYIKL
tara:strand:+ start:4175 stop:4471 length:297 start_codon:yes stop_codon:yes gene_type:complete